MMTMDRDGRLGAVVGALTRSWAVGVVGLRLASLALVRPAGLTDDSRGWSSRPCADTRMNAPRRLPAQQGHSYTSRAGDIVAGLAGAPGVGGGRGFVRPPRYAGPFPRPAAAEGYRVVRSTAGSDALNRPTHSGALPRGCGMAGRAGGPANGRHPQSARCRRVSTVTWRFLNRGRSPFLLMGGYELIQESGVGRPPIIALLKPGPRRCRAGRAPRPLRGRPAGTCHDPATGLTRYADGRCSPGRAAGRTRPRPSALADGWAFSSPAQVNMGAASRGFGIARSTKVRTRISSPTTIVPLDGTTARTFCEVPGGGLGDAQFRAATARRRVGPGMVADALPEGAGATDRQTPGPFGSRW